MAERQTDIDHPSKEQAMLEAQRTPQIESDKAQTVEKPRFADMKEMIAHAREQQAQRAKDENLEQSKEKGKEIDSGRGLSK